MTFLNFNILTTLIIVIWIAFAKYKYKYPIQFKYAIKLVLISYGIELLISIFIFHIKNMMIILNIDINNDYNEFLIIPIIFVLILVGLEINEEAHDRTIMKKHKD